jgi:MFS family permease
MPGMKTMAIARTLGLDGNPMRRRTDKIRARFAALLLAVFLIGAPFLSVAAVGWAGHHWGAELRAERSWRQVSAVLLQGAPTLAATGRILGYYQVLARWTTPDGRARTGRIPVSAEMLARRTVPLWVDSAGSPTGFPLNHHRLVLAGETTAAAVAIMALGIVLSCLAWAGRWVLDGAGSPTGKRDGPLSVLNGPSASGRGASRGIGQTRQVMRGRG